MATLTSHCQFVKCGYCNRDAEPNETEWTRYSFGVQQKKLSGKVFLTYFDLCPECFEEWIIVVNADKLETK